MVPAPLHTDMDVTAMLTIWGRANSGNVRKAVWCLEELGLAYERRDAGGPFGIVGDPAYRALNPNGLVPTLQDGALTVWESGAIVRYLAARYGSGTLWQDDPAQRAIADQWMDWTATTVQPLFGPAFVGLVRTPPEKRDPAAIAASLEATGAKLAIADAALADRPFLAGDRLTTADMPLGAIVYGWFGLPAARPALPHLEDWYRRLTARPAYRKGVMTPLT